MSIYLSLQTIELHAVGDLAIKLAIQANNFKVVKYLVECGADIDIALEVAIKNNRNDIEEYLILEKWKRSNIV